MLCHISKRFQSGNGLYIFEEEERESGIFLNFKLLVTAGLICIFYRSFLNLFLFSGLWVWKKLKDERKIYILKNKIKRDYFVAMWEQHPLLICWLPNILGAESHHSTYEFRNQSPWDNISIPTFNFIFLKGRFLCPTLSVQWKNK